MLVNIKKLNIESIKKIAKNAIFYLSCNKLLLSLYEV